MVESDYIQPPLPLRQIIERTEVLGFNMASDARTGALLRTLAAAKPKGRLLEMGTGTGIATAWLLAEMDAYSISATSQCGTHGGRGRLRRNTRR